MTLDDSIKDLTAAITGNTSKIVHYTQKLNTLENNLTKTIGTTMTRLIAVGKEQVFSEGALAREFRNTGLSLKESLGLLSTSISVGLRSYDSGAKRLLTTVTKLGLNQNSFADMMAYNTEILGMSSRASTKLADHIVSLGREFGIDSNLLVKGLRSLEGTTRRYAIQYGGAGASNLQRVATTVAAALGPQYAGGVSKLIDLVAGSTVKDYSTGAMFGGTGLAGDASPSDMMDKISKMSGSIVDMASNYGVFGSELPFMVDIFGKSLRIDQEMLQLARKIDSTPGLKESLGLEIARQMDVTQMKYDVKRNIKSLIASFEATLLPYAVDFTKWLSSNVGNMSKFVDDTMQQIAAKFKDWNVRGSWQEFLKTTESAFKDLLAWTQGQLPHLWSTYMKPAWDWVKSGGRKLYEASEEFLSITKGFGSSPAGKFMKGEIGFGGMLGEAFKGVAKDIDNLTGNRISDFGGEVKVLLGLGGNNYHDIDQDAPVIPLQFSENGWNPNKPPPKSPEPILPPVVEQHQEDMITLTQEQIDLTRQMIIMMGGNQTPWHIEFDKSMQFKNFK